MHQDSLNELEAAMLKKRLKFLRVRERLESLRMLGNSRGVFRAACSRSAMGQWSNEQRALDGRASEGCS